MGGECKDGNVFSLSVPIDRGLNATLGIRHKRVLLKERSKRFRRIAVSARANEFAGYERHKVRLRGLRDLQHILHLSKE